MNPERPPLSLVSDGAVNGLSLAIVDLQPPGWVLTTHQIACRLLENEQEGQGPAHENLGNLGSMRKFHDTISARITEGKRSPDPRREGLLLRGYVREVGKKGGAILYQRTEKDVPEGGIEYGETVRIKRPRRNSVEAQYARTMAKLAAPGGPRDILFSVLQHEFEQVPCSGCGYEIRLVGHAHTDHGRSRKDGGVESFNLSLMHPPCNLFKKTMGWNEFWSKMGKHRTLGPIDRKRAKAARDVCMRIGFTEEQLGDDFAAQIRGRDEGGLT